jgi:hypothetical protein
MEVMMRVVLCIWLVTLATTSYAVDYRWYPNSGSNQGVLEANIQNKDGSLFTISCGYFNSEHTAGIDWQSRKFQLNGIKDVQVVVGGVNYPFTVTFLYMASLKKSGGTFNMGNLATNAVLKSLVATLIHSRAGEFMIEVPQDNVSEAFSLLGARDVLLGHRFEDISKRRSVPKGHSIVDACVG